MVDTPPWPHSKAPYTVGTLSASLISKPMIFGLDNDTGVPCTREITCDEDMSKQHQPNKIWSQRRRVLLSMAVVSILHY